jgi:hypothetical protein
VGAISRWNCVSFERRTADGRIESFMVTNTSEHDREKLNLPLAVTMKVR